MTDIWELYHQTGPDGQEWGVKIRPGYIVIGFTREDAEAVVAWQNAAVSRPAGDVLERAKAAVGRLDLPWEYDEYENEIVTHTLQTEYGEYGGDVYQYHEPAVDY